jgi:hypothetical protein
LYESGELLEEFFKGFLQWAKSVKGTGSFKGLKSEEKLGRRENGGVQ